MVSNATLLGSNCSHKRSLELGVKQPSATESTVSRKIPVTKSGQRPSPRRREELNRSLASSAKEPLPQSQKSGKRKSEFADREKRSKQRPPRSRRMTLALYSLRLLILGVGIGALAGTLLSVLDPTSRIAAKVSQSQVPEQQEQISPTVPALKLSQEIIPLKTVVQQLAARNTKLLPGVFFVDLDTGAYLDLNGTSSFAAASMIKFPVLVAFFQDVDAGKIRLDEMLTLKQELIGGGSGSMQYKPPGTKFTALETATKMIVISDNTATNMLIARLGGIAALNQRFQDWGLTATTIRNPLPDLAGTNTTSPYDLAQLMALVNQGDLMSLRSRDRLLNIMQRTMTKTLLPRGLGQGATIAHKTGDIGKLVGDVGLVDMPSGKRYIAVAMVKRPHNDNRAQELIRQISRAAYTQFNKPTMAQSKPAIPAGTATRLGGTNSTGTPTVAPN